MRLSADPSGEIDELVEQLESVASPWQKVKVLAKSWRTVRKLQPDERFLVAKNLGLEGAEAFLDKLGDPNIGVPADDLLDIVRAADAQDFNRWKEVVGRLRRPEERQKVLRKGLEEARQALLQERQEAESIGDRVFGGPTGAGGNGFGRVGQLFGGECGHGGRARGRGPRGD